MSQQDISAGLAFLRAAHRGIGKSVGDRDRSTLLHSAMEIAIKGKMLFSLDEIAALQRLQVTSSVGVFRPFSDQHYSMACLAGGTFPRVWEKAFNWTPFKAPLVATSSSEVRKDSRVAPGIAVLIPGHDAEDLMPRFDGHQVWWCTSISTTKGTITLSRYKLVPGKLYPFSREGHPVNVKSLSHATWAAFVGTTEEAAA
ncbi:hypothetical protein HKW90_03790 [Pseudomonas aeruginosa]|nr:hypothetical protein [Pseudomonas aeruginosa]